jgi:DNA-binding beta-propeller fold protein YncE
MIWGELMVLFSGRWLLFAAMSFALAACAPVQNKKSGSAPQALIYPTPPDEPRFAYERMIVNSANVTGFSSDDLLKSALAGTDLVGEGLAKPYAIAVHRGRIFVSDTSDRSIKVFDVPEKRFFRITDTATGMLKKPLGIDVDAKGNLYVADATARVIHVFDRDGKHLRQIGDGKDFDRLSSVTVNPEGTKVYAVDIGGVKSENHRVRVFDAVNGHHLIDIGKRGSGPGEFNLPRDLAIGRDGRLYVVDGGNFRIEVFDRDGKYLAAFGKVGKQMGDFARPKEIATDAEGNVYVADAAFGNFQVFSPDGELLMFVGERSEANGPAKYMLPSGIFVDEDGRVYMVDQWFRKVDVFRPYGLPEGTGYFQPVKTTSKAGG